MKRIALLKTSRLPQRQTPSANSPPIQRVKEIPRHLPCGYYYLYHSHEHCLPFLHSELVYPDRDINRGWHMDNSYEKPSPDEKVLFRSQFEAEELLIANSTLTTTKKRTTRKPRERVILVLDFCNNFSFSFSLSLSPSEYVMEKGIRIYTSHS